ncbi:AAA family ATPase [Oceanicola sp. 502str15]|uniref:AAA family ATPase n=1 Tax=Oceanicola sp. 502str15 TaxID=2696061 RepID=UPI0020961FB2|nr:AAA family ATPase [Oceanicola sp. 502str15]MCO6381584.1 AAA family ATPase [Oceanicola sp. 502str15]
MSALVVLAGLPGSGKTTVSRALARLSGAIHLRIDTVETAISASVLAPEDVADAGYRVAQAQARDFLAQGHSTIIDCVNQWQMTRDWFCEIATGQTRLVTCEITCSNEITHRKRVESRRADLPGHKLPDWQAVLERDYNPWAGAELHIDTATASPEAAAGLIFKAMSAV